jgi:hypothetical protein
MTDRCARISTTRGVQMAHDSHANAFIKDIQAGVKQVNDLQKTVLDRFIHGNEVPTKKDVEDYKKLYVEAEKLSKVMWADINECEKAMGGFGGPADTWFSSCRQSIQALARKAH